MPLKVVCFCFYLTDISSGWRGRDFDAHDFVQATKGNSINGYAQIPVLGKIHRIDNSNLSLAPDLYADLVADYVSRNPIRPPLKLVPVPNSSSVSGATSPRTEVLSQAIARKLSDDAVVVDCLRWKKRLPSASTGGGTRDPEVLYKNLLHISKIATGSYVLVDDVLTSGGHLRACAAYLKANGGKVHMAFCLGRSTQTQEESPFTIIDESLDEYVP